MIKLQQSEATAARRRMPVYLVDICDGFTPETGITPTMRISKNGGASAAAGGSITEVDSTNMKGYYYYEFTQAELDTVGHVAVHFSNAATRDFLGVAQVVAYDPYSDFTTTIPTLATEANATTNTNSIITEVDANETKIDLLATEANATTNKNDIITEVNANETKIDTLTTTVGTINTNMDFVNNIEGGKWEITSNQMIFYKSDNATEVARFNLYDVNGNPAETNVYKRERV